MLSQHIQCYNCGEVKPIEEGLLPVQVLEGIMLHLFCVTCGASYQVTAENGLYKITYIGKEE
jgi:hypothetical protein